MKNERRSRPRAPTRKAAQQSLCNFNPSSGRREKQSRAACRGGFLTLRQRFFLFWARQQDDEALFARWRSLRLSDFPDLALAVDFSRAERNGQLDPTSLTRRAAAGCPYSAAEIARRRMVTESTSGPRKKAR